MHLFQTRWCLPQVIILLPSPLSLIAEVTFLTHKGNPFIVKVISKSYHNYQGSRTCTGIARTSFCSLHPSSPDPSLLLNHQKGLDVSVPPICATFDITIMNTVLAPQHGARRQHPFQGCGHTDPAYECARVCATFQRAGRRDYRVLTLIRRCFFRG